MTPALHSAARPRRARRAQRGLTLIELTVAMGIVVVLFASVVWGVGAMTGAKAKESAGELAGIIRSLYDSAALSGRTCRLVFQLPEKRDEDSAVTYHAECAKTGITAAAKREEELREANSREKDKEKRKAAEERDTRFRRLDNDLAPTVQELQAREQSRVEESARYASFNTEDVPERTLPSNVRVEVWTQKQRDPVKNGTAYLYFFPQGFTERAQVYVRQGKNVWTISVQPLTGKTIVVSEELEVPHS